MKPYFEQDGITLYHAPCLELLSEIGPASIGVTLTDPPYTKRVHDGARSNRRLPQIRRDHGGGPMRPIDFESISDEDLAACFAQMAGATRRWLIATTAFEHAARLYANPPGGMKPIRVGAWVKTNPMPQLSGDRPGQGWEAISISHAPERCWWNGGGRPATYIGPSEHGSEYPTQKPTWLISQIISDFADPGDLVLDPFCGGGTTLVCAWRAGLPAIGGDIREEALEIAARRLEREMRQGRLLAPTVPRPEQASLIF